MTETTKPVLHKVQLENITFDRFSADRCHGKYIPGNGMIHITSAETTEQGAENQAWHIMDISIAGTAPNQEDAKENRLFEISVAVRGHFRGVSSDVSEQEIMQFAATQGQFLLWPYVREAVQSFAQRLGIPPLVIPTIDVVKTLNAMTEDQEQEPKETVLSGNAD